MAISSFHLPSAFSTTPVSLLSSPPVHFPVQYFSLLRSLSSGKEVEKKRGGNRRRGRRDKREEEEEGGEEGRRKEEKRCQVLSPPGLIFFPFPPLSCLLSSAYPFLTMLLLPSPAFLSLLVSFLNLSQKGKRGGITHLLSPLFSLPFPFLSFPDLR